MARISCLFLVMPAYRKHGKLRPYFRTCKNCIPCGFQISTIFPCRCSAIFSLKLVSASSNYSAYTSFNWKSAPGLDVFHRCHRQRTFIKLVKIAQSRGNVNSTGAKTTLIELVTTMPRPFALSCILLGDKCP